MPNFNKIWAGTVFICAFSIIVYLLLTWAGFIGIFAFFAACIVAPTLLVALLNAVEEWKR